MNIEELKNTLTELRINLDNEIIRNKIIRQDKKFNFDVLIQAIESYIQNFDVLIESTNDILLNQITTKVKSSLSNVKNLPGFDATRVKVITENGTVYLLGLVHKNEGNVATEIARRETGVKQVVKVFEYIK